MRRLLVLLATLSLRRPRTLGALVLLPTLGLSMHAFRVPFDLSFTGIMDREKPEVERYAAASHRYGFGGRLLLLLEGPEELLDPAVTTLEPLLSAHPEVRAVLAGSDATWLAERLPWLVPRSSFDAWLGLATEPLEELDVSRAQGLATELEELQPPHGVRLVQVKLKHDPLEVAVGGGTFFELEAMVSEALSGTQIEASFSGLPAIAAQDQGRTLTTIERLSPLSLLAVLCILRLIERRLLGLLAVAAILLLATGATVGAVGLLTGKLTVMETFFGVTVFGLGIDFAVHLTVRQREERAQGAEAASALRRALVGTGRGVAAGAFTTAGAFFIVALAPDPVALHLGLAGGIGILACLTLMLTLLPLLWRWQDRSRKASSEPPRLKLRWVGALAGHAASHPMRHLAVAATIAAVALAGVPRFRVETNLAKVFNRQVPALETTRRIQEAFGLNGSPWIAAAESLEEARQLGVQFTADPLFSRAESLADLMPPDSGERRRLLVQHRGQIDQRIALIDRLLPLAPSPRLADLRRLRQALERLARANDLGPPTVATLPATLRDKLIGPDGELLVYAYAYGSALDGSEARRQRLVAQAIHPGTTGLGALLEAVMVGERAWVWPVFLGILVFVCLVLLADLRDPGLALLALIPVGFGVPVTFGLLCWFDVGFNIMTILVVPLIIGLGVDDGIHVVHRIKEGVDPSVAAAAAAVGQAIVMTTATTLSSFAVLLLTDHPGLESMGLVMLLGMPLCLLASITTLPALAVLLRVRSSQGLDSESAQPFPERAGR